MHHRHYGHGSAAGMTAGTSLLSAAVAAAITYYLFGTRSGAEKRRRVKKWAEEAKEKVSSASLEVKEAAREIYDDVTDMISERYDDLKEVREEEMTALAGRIRDHWEDIRDDIEETIERSRKKLAR